MGPVFERFARKSPVAVMTRALMERALAPEGLDKLFEQTAERQYVKQLLFSSTVNLMAAVVCGVHPSVRKAHQAMRDQLPVSLAAVYDKLNRTELRTTQALVSYSADRLRPVLEALVGTVEPWLAGYRIKVLDGNHLAASERRLEVLRGCAAGPLPGQSLVVLEPETGLVVQMVGCEDGHAQERSLLDPVLALVSSRDVYVADRNFCTLGFLLGVAQREGFFIIRQHAQIPIESAGTLRQRGRTESGRLFEQRITLRQGERTLSARRIVIRLDTPTRDGETEIAILTNLPVHDASAVIVADLYHRRWTIESLFARVERNLASELSTLAYPGAALFAFGVALAASNVFAVVHATMTVAQKQRPDPKLANMPLSDFAIVEAARTVYDGMSIALEGNVWDEFQTLPPARMASQLLGWANNICWQSFRKTTRGPKTPTERTRFKNTPHVSTARLLEGTSTHES